MSKFELRLWLSYSTHPDFFTIGDGNTTDLIDLVKTNHQDLTTFKLEKVSSFFKMNKIEQPASYVEFRLTLGNYASVPQGDKVIY